MDLVAKTVTPKSLEPAERSAFIDRLYGVHDDVFAGVSRESFAAYVVESQAERTEIRVFEDPDGELAGYIALHFFERELGGEACVIIRAEAGMKRAYRGANLVGPFMVRQVVLNALRDSRPTWYMGSLVHPSSFCALTRHAQTFWPHPELPTPPDVLDLMCSLAEEFGLRTVDADRPLVRDVGWITRDTAGEQAYWRQSTRPLARFFIEQNPDFHRGHGLVTLIPIGREELGRGVWSWGLRTVERRLAGVGRMLRRVSGQARLTLADAVDELSGTPAFEGVPDGTLTTLLERGTQREHPAGSTLFRQGDHGSSMYVVLEGSVYVLLDSGIGQSVVIDQLGTGDSFGELALVSGAPRSASIRAATDSVLLEIDGRTLWDLVEELPELGEVMWGNVGRFRFDNLVRGKGPFAELDRTQRVAWWETGRRTVLEDGEEAPVGDATWLVVYDGEVQVDTTAGWMLLGAPSMVPIAGARRVIGCGETRIAWLDAPPGISV